MIKVVVAGLSSGSGKTTVTCALLAALKRRGLAPCAFKCGPDYIDPMFHRSVLGVDGRNLDLFLSNEDALRRSFRAGCAGHGAVVCEGVMGFYDGLGGTTDRASTWHVADTLDLPVLLVVRPQGASLTLAAQVRGVCAFRANSHIRGILLNDCSPMLFQSLGPMLERETGLPVLGYLPHAEAAVFPSRHLGLYTAGEIADLTERVERLGIQWENSVDMERFLSVFSGMDEKEETKIGTRSPVLESAPRIAVAQDEAFCFVYQESLDALRRAGAELVFFSPLKDVSLPPETRGLYLPGGYPELHARQLSENRPMRDAIRTAVQAGVPTVAECGGFLYLCQELETPEGIVWPMAGVLPGRGVRREKLVRFGYAYLTAEQDSLLVRIGEKIPIHEFHYWDCTDNGTAFQAQKPTTGRTWRCGFASGSLYAAFPHLYFAGNSKLAQRFVEAAKTSGQIGKDKRHGRIGIPAPKAD